MKSILKILHLPELLFIIVVQYLFRICIIHPHYGDIPLQVNGFQFFMLVLATVLVAAGGFLIKYYFDTRHYEEAYLIRMYEIDKPLDNAETLNKWAIGLFIAGSILGFLVGYGIGMFNLGLIFMLAATVLYYYALRYQGLMFWGNLVLGLLVALVPVVVWLFEYFATYKNPEIFIDLIPVLKILNNYALAYSAYLFIMVFVLKILRDLRKVEYDKDCFFKTFPVVLGNKKAINWVVILSVLVIVAVLSIQFGILFTRFPYFAVVIAILVQAPLVVLIAKILKVSKDEEYKFAFNILRWSMFLGVLTMVAATHNIFTQWIF